MKVRKVGVAALASALALGGMIAGSVGEAVAAKPVLQGTLSCAASGSTTISPGLVLTTSQLPPPKFKDKKPKYTTNGAGSGCTGTTTSGTMPTSITSISSKAKGDSRVISNPNAVCTNVGRASKTKVTFSTGDKLKTTLTSDVNNYAFTPTGPTTGTLTSFPPCGSSTATALAFAAAHIGDRIATVSHGVSGGKAYAGKNITSTSVTTETLGQELTISQTPTGVTLLHGDPAYSTFVIG